MLFDLALESLFAFVDLLHSLVKIVDRVGERVQTVQVVDRELLEGLLSARLNQAPKMVVHLFALLNFHLQNLLQNLHPTQSFSISGLLHFSLLLCLVDNLTLNFHVIVFEVLQSALKYETALYGVHLRLGHHRDVNLLMLHLLNILLFLNDAFVVQFRLLLIQIAASSHRHLPPLVLLLIDHDLFECVSL